MDQKRKRAVTMDDILEIQNITKSYGQLRAVDYVSLRIEKGLCLGLLGPNGAGKTTMVEIMEGILLPDSGTILYKGAEINASFKEEIGIMFQQTALLGYMTVAETLSTFHQLYEKKATLHELISQCNLSKIQDQMNDKISGGQKQRLLMALALVNDPELIFLDEPSTGLDPQARRMLWDLIAKIKSQGKTIVLTTHYMEEAEALCDEVAIMDLGRIIARGTPKDLIEIHGADPTLMIPDYHIAHPIRELGDHLKTDVTITEKKGWIALQSKDINGLISELLNKDIELSEMSILSSNLENVFLNLTGRRLRD